MWLCFRTLEFCAVVVCIPLDVTNWICCILRSRRQSSLCCRPDLLHNHLLLCALLNTGGLTGYLVKESEQHVGIQSVLSSMKCVAFSVVSNSGFSNLHLTLKSIFFQHVPDHWIPSNFTEVAACEFSCYYYFFTIKKKGICCFLFTSPVSIM